MGCEVAVLGQSRVLATPHRRVEAQGSGGQVGRVNGFPGPWGRLCRGLQKGKVWRGIFQYLKVLEPGGIRIQRRWIRAKGQHGQQGGRRGLCLGLEVTQSSECSHLTFELGAWSAGPRVAARLVACQP
jgi:hypothetical protein